MVNSAATERVNDFALDAYVTAPAAGVLPNTAAIVGPQYLGVISWKKADGTPHSGNFAAGAVYKADVTLNAKSGYTFAALQANSFTYPGAAVSHAAGSGASLAVGVTFPATDSFVAVTDIAGIPAQALAQTALTLAGAVQPDNASHKTIVWTVTDPGTAGAVIPEGTDTLNTAAAGTVTVTASIANGAAQGRAFTKDFTITVLEPGSLIAVSDLSLTGRVTAPVKGAVPDTAPISAAQFTGTVAWKTAGGAAHSGNFAAGAAYLAEVTLNAKSGYTFDGVAANAFTYTGAAVAHAAGGGAGLAVTITFPATGSAESVTVTFQTGGGSGIPSQTLPAGGGYVYQPVPPVKTGYAFAAWYADAAFTLYFNFNNPVSADTVIYAKWDPITYTVAFDGNGGAGSMEAVTCVYDAPRTLPANGFTPGALFAGWNTQRGGGGTAYTGGQEIVNLMDAQGASITLYAQWSKIIDASQIAAYLAGKSGGLTSDDPIPMVVALGLSGANWEAVITAIVDSGKYVSLDLAGCTNGLSNGGGGLGSDGVFDPYYSRGYLGIDNKIVNLTLPDAAGSIAEADSMGSYFSVRYWASLKTVTGAEVHIINNNSFNDNYGGNVRTSVSFPMATSIGEGAFINNYALTSVNIPKATSIGRVAFGDCRNLASVTFGATPPALGDNVLIRVDDNNTITVRIPESAKSAYGVPNLPGTNFNNSDRTTNNWGNRFRKWGVNGVDHYVNLIFETY
ncbi:MAG: leucine-rich repeat domain-containing protein [Treponema sp.]|jgi:uncharacterized repeat protein (TIGR02543 family)|nr:leucine-rich repeat domain-containing protein [Treponema sp.]